jgi:hypothetical protein
MKVNASVKGFKTKQNTCCLSSAARNASFAAETSAIIKVKVRGGVTVWTKGKG